MSGADVLTLALDERRPGARLDAIDRRGRRGYMEGVEEQSRKAEGRPLTPEELERALRAAIPPATDETAGF